MLHKLVSKRGFLSILHSPTALLENKLTFWSTTMKDILESILDLAKESDGNTRIAAIAVLGIISVAVGMKS